MKKYDYPFQGPTSMVWENSTYSYDEAVSQFEAQSESAKELGLSPIKSGNPSAVCERERRQGEQFCHQSEASAAGGVANNTTGASLSSPSGPSEQHEYEWSEIDNRNLVDLRSDMNELVKSYPEGAASLATPEYFSDLDIDLNVAIQRLVGSEVKLGKRNAVIQDNGPPVAAVRSSRGDYIFSDTKIGAAPIAISARDKSSIVNYLDDRGHFKVTSDITELQAIYVGFESRPNSARFNGKFPNEDSTKSVVNGFANFLVRTGMPKPDVGVASPGAFGKPIASAITRLRQLVRWEKTLSGEKKNGVMLKIQPYPEENLVKVGSGSITFREIAKTLRVKGM